MSPKAERVLTPRLSMLSASTRLARSLPEPEGISANAEESPRTGVVVLAATAPSAWPFQFSF